MSLSSFLTLIRPVCLDIMYHANGTHTHSTSEAKLAICLHCLTVHLVLSDFILSCILLLSSLWCIIRTPFLFLFLLPSERPPIGFGGGRRLCRIIMGSSWENCPWKGLSEKKEKNLVLFPILLGNIHQGTPAVRRGAIPLRPQSSHWLGHFASAKSFIVEVKTMGFMEC